MPVASGDEVLRLRSGRRVDANRLPVAARIGPTGQLTGSGIDGDAVGVTRHFVPRAPVIDRVATPLQLGDRLGRETAFDMQGVARLEQAEAAGQEARHFERLLDVERS